MVVNFYVDAGFGGIYGYEDSQEPIFARNRTGYFITLANYLLVCVSNLQTGVSPSTLHSEYVAFSQYLRDFLPLKNNIK